METPAKDPGSKTYFLKKNWQVIYAVVLVAIVPATIVLNTFFVISRFRATVDVELQRTALLIGKIVNVTSKATFADPAALQTRLEDVAKVIPEVRMLEALRKDGDDFTVVAGTDRSAIGKTAHGKQNVLAWYDDQAIAYLTKSSRSSADEAKLTAEEASSDTRYWGVAMPLKDEQGKKVLLLSAKISLSVIDALVRDNLFWSYVWLAVTVLIIVLILASNTRLFQYAALFRKIKEVDKMKDDFISMASHELRAPITAIRGYLSLFLEDAFGKMDEKPKQVLQTTFQISNHLGSLVEDLLEVSRIEQGRMQLTLEPTTVEEAVDEVIGEFKYEAEKKSLALEFKKPKLPLPMISADKSRLRQVLVNFVSNGIKYTPKGSVTVTAEVKDEKFVEIRVMDTGLGMSGEQREKLFQKFYRIKTDDTRAIPGTGLGLWITRQIVELMKGKIYVDSIEKVGTQFSVVFPALSQDASEQPAEPQKNV